MDNNKNQLKINKRVFLKSFKNGTNDNTSDPEKFMSSHFKKIKRIITHYAAKFNSIKFQLILTLELEKKTDEFISTCEPFFLSQMIHVLGLNNISDLIKKSFQFILLSFDNFLTEGSGWIFKKIISLDLKIIRIEKTLQGGCKKYITLPKELRFKKALLAIDSPENSCFIYSIAACLKKTTGNANRYRHYTPLVSKLKGYNDWMSISQIANFEYLNNLRVNVYQWKNSKLNFLYKTSNQSGPICNLLLYKRHYFSIRNLNRLIGKQGKKKYFCQRCFIPFGTMNALGNHNKICISDSNQIYFVPKTKDKIKFKNFGNMVKQEIIYYADFESILKPLTNKFKGEKTQLLKRHIPVSFGLLRVCVNQRLNKGPIVFHGKNIISKFWEVLELEMEEIEHLFLNENYPLQMSKQDYLKHKKLKRCEICQKRFSKLNPKMRDHYHSVGPKISNYRYTLCNRCNLTFASNKNIFPISIVFHNLSGYDSHLIISELEKYAKNREKIQIIPRNSEKYISFTIGRWRFIDSFQFLHSSLDTLVQSMKTEGISSFKHVSSLFPNDEKKTQHLICKHAYPYNFPKSYSDYHKHGFPSKEDFNNELKPDITDEQYNFTKYIFKLFQCKTFFDFHILYLKSDICLLADVFENYRNICLNGKYKLDPTYYISSPQLGFDSMLRLTGVQLDFLDSLEKVEFIERGIRGGISVISRRYARANNEFTNYDPSKPKTYIIYLDCNGLYSEAMKSRLPARNFRFLSKKEIENFDVMSKLEEDKYGFILEVDIDYPKSIHDITADYPLAPEKISITDNELSSKSLEFKKKLNLKNMNSVQKLIPNVNDKKKYIVHYLNLIYYIKQGMVLKKIHRILEFEQEAWLKSFVEYNTHKRNESNSNFQKMYYKLLTNSVYGKLLENKRKRQNIHLSMSEKHFDKLVAKPNFIGVRIFNNHLAAITLQKTKVLMDKAIYAGFTVLEISKLIMQKFYRHITQELYKPNQVNLLLTDTDSFIFEIQTENVYDDFLKLGIHLDTSNYPKSHPLYSEKNKGTTGKFKDEVPPSVKGGIISEFVGLKSKLYSFITTQNSETKKAKGLNRNSITKINHNTYLNSLLNHSTFETTVHSLRSYGHKIYTIEMQKSLINGFDDKRFILQDNIRTLPHFHYLIPKIRDETATKSVELTPVSTDLHDIGQRNLENMASKQLFKIGEHKTVTISKFREKIYFHFSDITKNKSLTFNQSELELIIEKGEKLLKVGNTLLKTNKKRTYKPNNPDSGTSSSSSNSESSEEDTKKKKRTKTTTKHTQTDGEML